MNFEINNNEDIFDIAISMKYFKNSISSGDTIHTYANHFLYKSVYIKLLSFSKEELETVFWDHVKKEFHPNPKSKYHEIKFVKNIFELNISLKNPLFFAAFIEKNAFKESYHPVVKFLLKNKNTPHSLDFLNTLYHIQTAQRLNEPTDSMKNISDFDRTIFNFSKDLDTEEKNEVFMNYINQVSKKNPRDFVNFILNNLKNFNDEHLLIINSKIKEYNININQYKLFEEHFPKKDKPNDRFFISATSHEMLDKAFDFGFRANNYEYNNLNLISSIYSYGLNGNNIGDTWQINFIKKILQVSTLEEANTFTIHIGSDLVKLKQYGYHFANIAKEALNKKLHENLPELSKSKQPKI